jgi:hypothetical protein
MFSKVAIFALTVILAAPICAVTGASTPPGGNSAGAGSDGHSSGGGVHAGGGGGGAGHGSGATGGAARSSGLSGRAAGATARSTVDGHATASRAGASPTDAMHATHLAGGKLSEGEHTTSKSPGMDHHHNPYRREPRYDHQYWLSCLPGHDEIDYGMWLGGCNGITKSRSGHKS